MMIIQGNSIHIPLKNESIQCCITSPPYYGLRDYGVDGQLGLESSPEEYIKKMVMVFREVKRVLKPNGVLWVNIGDSYWGGKGKSNLAFQARRESSSLEMEHHNIFAKLGSMRPTDGKHETIKPKDLIGIPWMLAFALRGDGWFLRQDIIWHKPNPMPESVRDRCTKAHEYVFLLSKSERYYWDQDAIREPHSPDNRKDTVFKGSEKYADGFGPATNSSSILGHERWPGDGRNKRSVWSIPTQSYSGSHFATFPEKLVEPMILAGSRPGDVVLDPFSGSGTTGLVAERNRRKFIGIELNHEYICLAKKRMSNNQIRLVA